MRKNSFTYKAVLEISVWQKNSSLYQTGPKPLNCSQPSPRHTTSRIVDLGEWNMAEAAVSTVAQKEAASK
jgi:hypothetical protein